MHRRLTMFLALSASLTACAASGPIVDPTGSGGAGGEATSSTGGAGGTGGAACEGATPGLPACEPASQCSTDPECPKDAYCNLYVMEGACTSSEGCDSGQCFPQGDTGALCSADTECLTRCGLACDLTASACAIVDQAAHDACL